MEGDVVEKDLKTKVDSEVYDAIDLIVDIL